MDLVNEVKSRLSIVDVVSDYVALDPSSLKALCPFHEERTPSFSVSRERDSWRCWGACADGGDIISFVMRAESIEFREALNKLCDMAGVELPSRQDDDGEGGENSKRVPVAKLYEVNQIAEEFFARQLMGAKGGEALAYLQSRGIDADTARRRGIGYAPQGLTNSLMEHLRSMRADSRAVRDSGLIRKNKTGSSWHDAFSNRITISIRDAHHRIIGFGARAMEDDEPKYLNTEATAIFDKSQALYGVNWAAEAIRTTGKAIIVEGYMDVIAAHEHGFKNVVATMGTAVTTQQLKTLASLMANNQQSKTVVMCLDSDSAGQNATIRSLQTSVAGFRHDSGLQSNETLGSSVDIRVARPVISDDSGATKDPDEAIRHSPAKWQSSIDSAVEALDFLIDAHIKQHDTTTDEGIDGVLTEVVSYFNTVPPSTFVDIRRLKSLATQLKVDYDAMIEVLKGKHHQKRAQSPNWHRERNGRRATNGVKKNLLRSVSRMPNDLRYGCWERDLMACIAQYDFAIDHAQSIMPHYFRNALYGKLLDLFREHGSADPVRMSIVGENDSEMLLTFEELTRTQVIPHQQDEDHQSLIIKVVTHCAVRTRQEHLKRSKVAEAKYAQENGNRIPDPDVQRAVKTNYEIKQVTFTAQEERTDNE